MKPPLKNVIVEVISGPEGVDLRPYVVRCNSSCKFGGIRAASPEVITINDPAMSRCHFEIFNEDGEIKLKDCDSKNGTKVDGRMVSEETLQESSIFKAGRTRFQVRWEPILDESDDRPRDPEPVSQPQIPLARGIADIAKKEEVSPSKAMNSDDSASNSSLESSLVVAWPRSLGSSQHKSSRIIQPIEVPEDVSDETAHSIPEIFSAEPVIRMIKRTDQPTQEFKQTIKDLADHLDFFVIAHLAKLKMTEVPPGVRIPLFPHLDPHGSAYPVAIRKTDWLTQLHDQTANRLIELDGLLLIVSRPESEEPEECLLNLGIASVPGFSDKDGFVPWCWPSGVSSVLQTMSDLSIGKWLGSSLAGIVYLQKELIIAYTARDQVAALSGLGFE